MSQLGAIRDDLMKLLGLLGSGAQRKLEELEAYIRAEAEKGALDAVPRIRAEVRGEVKPYVVGAITIGALGLIAGAWALIAMRRRKGGAVSDALGRAPRITRQRRRRSKR